MPCPLVTAFMDRVERNFPILGDSADWRKKGFKTPLGDVFHKKLLGSTPRWQNQNRPWDWVHDNKGFWGDIITQNQMLPDPKSEELLARVQYALQLAVNELHIRGGPVVKKYGLDNSSLDAFAESLVKLREELEFYENIAHIGKKNDAVSQLHRPARLTVMHIQKMFENLGNFGGVGRHLADVFLELKLPKDMAMKTARKLLNL